MLIKFLIWIFSMSSYSFVPFNGRVDDTILAIKRNNIEIDPVSIGYNISKHTNFQEMNFPDLEVGDLVTITVFNVHSMAGILYEATINGVIYEENFLNFYYFNYLLI